jgi:hypothetical protein
MNPQQLSLTLLFPDVIHKPHNSPIQIVVQLSPQSHSGCLYWSEKKPCPISSHSHLPLAPGSPHPLSVSVNLPVLASSCWWNHNMRSLVCPCWDMGQHLSPSCDGTIFSCLDGHTVFTMHRSDCGVSGGASSLENDTSWAWWFTPVISALRRQR